MSRLLSFPSCVSCLSACSMCLANLQRQPCANLAFHSLHATPRLLNSFTWSFSQSAHTTFHESSPVSCFPFHETFFFFLPPVQTRSREMRHSHLFVSQKYMGTISLWCFTVKHCRLENSLAISEIVIGGLFLV